MPTITWLHLSDLHFRAEDQHAWDEDVVLRALLADVRQQAAEGLSPDLILVSGDIAFSGKPAEYSLAGAFFDELLAATDLPRERLFVVPGNHDVDRARIGVAARMMAPNLTSREAVNEVLGDATARRAFLERFEGYAAFLRDYLGHLPFDDERYFYVQPVELPGCRLTVLGLNSAWLALGGEEDRNRLALGERQVCAALDAAREADPSRASGPSLRLALLHHPFDWLGAWDRKGSEAMLSDRCHFILHGHIHEVGLLQARGPDSNVTIVAAGACYTSRRSRNAYNLVRLDLAAGEGTVHLRMYSDERGGFWTRDVTTYRNVDDGQYTFPLSLPARTARRGKKELPPVAVTLVADPAKLEATYLRKVQAACNTLPLALIDPRAMERTRQRTVDLLAVYVALDTLTQIVEEEGEERDRKALRRRAKGMATEGIVERLTQEAVASDIPDWLAELRPSREARILSALEAAADERQMVLLGDPGSGKSTFASYLALCLAGARLEEMGEAGSLPGEGWLAHLEPAWRHGALLPVRVTLRHFAASEHCDSTAAGLWAFIAETLAGEDLADFAPHLRRRLLEGGVLLIGDGLDEVADPEKRGAVRDAVADLATTYGHPANRYLLTCRVYAYQDPCWHLDRFIAHTLAPFSQEQIDAFVECWYREVRRLGWKTEAEAQDLTSRLKVATRRPDLAPLASSPLQLTMMASLHFSWGRLPDDRVELYQQMVDLLLVRWQEARLGEGAGVSQLVSAGELTSALEQVAFVAHRAQQGREGTADVSEASLLTVLKDYLEGDWNRARELLTYIQQRAGLLLERETGVYTFPHRSYQEYMAGSYLARQPDFPDQAANLIRENYAQWREVVLWAVGVMARLKRMTHVAVDVADALCPARTPGEVTSEIEWHAAHLAGEALLETGLKEVQARTRYGPVLVRVRDWLVATLERGVLAPAERAQAGRTLSHLGDPRFQEDAWSLPDEPLLGFVEIPAGLFRMGSDKKRDPGADDDEQPEHPVDLPAYYIARYPVTVAQFRAFVEDSGQQVQGEWERYSGPDNHPVVAVSWYDARAYCAWLTEQLQAWEDTPEPLASLLRVGADGSSPWVVRLPTEAEWEKAARGTEGRIFPWGNEPDPNRANYADTGIGATSAVGCFPAGASPYGVLDLSGNVWEWTQSLDRKYPYNPKDGREKLDDKGPRVLRGGAFDNLGGGVRCACRGGYYPDYWYWYWGFRGVVAPG